MKITSPVFENNQSFPSKYSCDGVGVSPALNFFEVPFGTKTLALIVDDPDAPNGTFVHWVVWNISAETKIINEGELPTGAVTGKNSLGQNSYVPACPPSGTHRYFFKIYALKITLDLPLTATKEDLLNKMNGHVLDQAELIGVYQKTAPVE